MSDRARRRQLAEIVRQLTVIHHEADGELPDEDRQALKWAMEITTNVYKKNYMARGTTTQVQANCDLEMLHRRMK